MTRLEYAKDSIRGKRKNQEDSCDFALMSDELAVHGDEAFYKGKLLAVLADGMGGHAGGACASRTVCAEFIKHYRSKGSGVSEGDDLTTSLHYGNQEILNRVSADETLAGMGSTFIGASFDKGNMYWISVGDSLLYLYRNNQFEQLNENHAYSSILNKQVLKGEITELEAKRHPQRNALLSAVTGREIEKIDLRKEPFPIYDDDWVILASDGLLSLSHEEIKAVIDAEKDDGPEAIVDALLKAVVEAGHPRQDNTTVMAIHQVAEDIDDIVEAIKPDDQQSEVDLIARWVVALMGVIILAACSLILINLTLPEEQVSASKAEKTNEAKVVEDGRKTPSVEHPD